MEEKKLKSLLDFITEKDMRQFENDHVKLKKVNDYSTSGTGMFTRYFHFETDDEAGFWIEFFISTYNGVKIEAKACYNGGFTGGYNEIFLAHQHQLLKPFIPFLKQKCKEIEHSFVYQSLKRNSKSHYFTFFGEPMLFQVKCVEKVSSLYEDMKKYYLHPNYNKDRTERYDELKKSEREKIN